MNDNSDLYDLAKEENNEEIMNEILGELKVLDGDVEEFRIENLFSGEADGNDCFIEINTGVGGVDACDFSEMLLNMYMKWDEKKKIYSYSLLNQLPPQRNGVIRTRNVRL